MARAASPPSSHEREDGAGGEAAGPLMPPGSAGETGRSPAQVPGQPPWLPCAPALLLLPAAPASQRAMRKPPRCYGTVALLCIFAWPVTSNISPLPNAHWSYHKNWCYTCIHFVTIRTHAILPVRASWRGVRRWLRLERGKQALASSASQKCLQQSIRTSAVQPCDGEDR